jgi:hypothetical protein
MNKNTAAVQDFFNRHKGIDELFFVGTMPFFKKSDANAQASNIAKATQKAAPEVVHVTREEAFGGEATAPEEGSDTASAGGSVAFELPVILEEDGDELKSAKNLVIETHGALTQALAAQKKQPAKTGEMKKAEAASKVAEAQAAFEAAKAALAEVTPKV